MNKSNKETNLIKKLLADQLDKRDDEEREKRKNKKTSENIWKICFKVLTFASAF